MAMGFGAFLAWWIGRWSDPESDSDGGETD